MQLLSVVVLVVTKEVLVTCADVLYYENIQSQEVRDNWETYPLGIIQNILPHNTFVYQIIWHNFNQQVIKRDKYGNNCMF